MRFSCGFTFYGRIAALGMVMSMIGPADRAHGALISRPILKSFFQSGDKPTQPQFATLIDSLLTAELDYGNTAAEHGIRLDNGRMAIDAAGQVRVMGAGETLGELDNFGGVGDNVTFNPLATGGAQDITTGGEFQLADGLHYGFLQMRMDPPDSPTPYAIHLRHFVYEDIPGVPITTFFQPIPEPTTLVLLGAGALALLRRRRRHEFNHLQGSRQTSRWLA